MRVLATARTRSPLVTMPARLSGSAALITFKRPSARRPPRLAQPSHRLGQGKLLSGHPRHEAAAANVAAQFETPIDSRQRTPGRDGAFTRQQAAEHDAVAVEQGPGLLLRARPRSPPPARRPAPATIGRRSRPECRRGQRSQPRETIGGDQSRSDELADGGSRVSRRESARRGQFMEKQRTSASERVQYARGGLARWPSVRAVAVLVCSHRSPRVEMRAHEERDRRRAHHAGGPRDSRAQPTSPVRHKTSSSAASYLIHPRGKHGSFPRAAPRTSYPSRRWTMARSPSRPVSRVANVSTCCHAKRKRVKSAGLTASISARRRLSV